MAVITNKNTAQDPVASGRTGTQVVKFFDAPRVYIKTKDSSPTPIVVKSSGTTPAGYTDLGIVDGKVKVTYSKEITEIRTGVDNILRSSFVRQRTGTFEATLSQLDDVVVENLSGVTPSVLLSGSIVQFALGAEDVIEKALILVIDNKLDGKELQFYAPAAQVSFSFEDSGDFSVIKMTANLPGFTYDSATRLFIMTDFA